MKPLEQLSGWVEESRSMVFFGGAGVSTASGIPDFRGAGGLYTQEGRYPPDEILSRDFFLQHTEDFFDFYRTHMLFPDAEPNVCHRKLAQWEREVKLAAVVTQNVDGLHEKAGSKTVYELHGNVHRNLCMQCGKSYDLGTIVSSRGVPVCDCGGILKPDVVLYGENLDENTLMGAIAAIRRADLLLVGGTSLAVYPAAGLLRYYEGSRLAVINQTPTAYDEAVDLVIHADLAAILSALP